MIFGIGCDIVAVGRIEKALEKQGFKERVYTAKEIAYCTHDDKVKVESYAARFAAKEAFLKAIGTGLREGTLQDIEIINDELGKPEIVLTGFFKDLATEKGINKVFVSLSHTKEFAIAQVILEV